MPSSARAALAALAPAAAGLLLACAAGAGGSPPVPTGVTPAVGSPFAATPVVIAGQGFALEAYQSASGGAVDATFRAWLGGVELADVAWVSATEIHATVPPGVPPGPQRLVVLDPGGGWGSLDAAFTVADAVKTLDDPFGDGTAFAFVFGWDGRLFLGPSAAGNGVVGCRPDGSGCASLSFSFSPDTTGPTTTANVCATGLVTLGATGLCDPLTPQSTACACGPDYESGRGMMGPFPVGSPPAPWLVAMGRTGKGGTVRHLYMTQGVVSPLGFSYVDLSPALPPTSGVTDVASMESLGGRLYVGTQVADADGPRIVVLATAPAPPGLEASAADAFATTLQNTPMGETGLGLSQVDAMLGFEGRLFVANRRAVLVSKTGQPTGAADASLDFDDCTPPAPGGWEATSIVKYASKIDLTPADRGVSGLAAWGGRLYLGRNTRPTTPPGSAPAVPELWAMTPRHDPTTGAFLGCSPADWQRVATNFGNAGSAALTALFASATHLYVGYDDPGGARLFRTASPAPASEADFRGLLGCAAPCASVAGPGLGDATNTRLFDARAIRYGGVEELWAVLGNGVGPVRVYRIAE